MPNLTYSVSDFLPFTKIISADVNARFQDIATLLNTTGLTSSNIQLHGLTRDRLAAGTANYVLKNDSSGYMSEEAQLAISRGGTAADLSGSLSGNGGLPIIVNSGETGFTVGSSLQSTITESLSGVVSSLTAAEAISANDACALDIAQDASGNNIYRVFKATYTNPGRRRSFLGFAENAGTVTAGVYTWTASANFVSSNVITYKINGRSYSTNFTTDNATTLQAVATQMATDPDVNGAVSDASHKVTVTGRGGLHINITNSSVTGGVSQPTITVATTTPAAGTNVRVRCFGPLTGFTSLTTGYQYYLSTAGGITATPADTNPVLCGQALSSTILFINTNVGQFQFGSPTVFVRASGTNTSSETGGQTDVEHFNFTSWSSGTTTLARCGTVAGDTAMQSNLYQIDGYDTASALQGATRVYNKTSWTSNAARSTPRLNSAGTVMSNTLYVGLGRNSPAGAYVVTLDSYNGASWTAGVASLNGSVRANGNAFTQNSKARFVGGSDGTNGYNTHTTWDGASVVADTVHPNTRPIGLGCLTSGGGITGASGATTESYRWAGSWSANIAMSYTPSDVIATVGNDVKHPQGGYFSAYAMAVCNGGYNGASQATSAQFNDASWSAGTSSANSRNGGTGGVC